MNDKLYRIILFVAALIVPIVCGGVVYALVTDAYDAFEHFGFLNFLTSSQFAFPFHCPLHFSWANISGGQRLHRC